MYKEEGAEAGFDLPSLFDLRMGSIALSVALAESARSPRQERIVQQAQAREQRISQAPQSRLHP